jgi:hypothetical protein
MPKTKMCMSTTHDVHTIEQLTVSELKEQLRERGLKVRC